MWLDGLYMGAPFIAEYGQLTNMDVAADVARQFIIVGSHTYDDSTRLYRHAWDETGQAAADKIATQKVTSQTNTLSEAFRSLPKGVYVINGRKIVKN